jgi:hypothetical protein
MHILCLEQGDWMKPSEYPSTARDWEARQFNDFHISPNRRKRDTDYPINDAGSPIKIANFNGVGGGTVRYAGHFPRLRRAGFSVLWLCSCAAVSSAAISPTSRLFLAKPIRKSTPLFSHQAISASRAKPESPRNRTRNGNLALQSNTTGTGNTAIGFDALGSTDGNENTAVGDAALTFSNTGNNNTAVGSGALEASS